MLSRALPNAAVPTHTQPARAATADEDTDNLVAEDQADGVAGQDIELPDDMAVNGGPGGGGFGLMAAEARRHRDVVDYMYMLMMLVFVCTIGYLTGSLQQFLIFFVGVLIILM